MFLAQNNCNCNVIDKFEGVIVIIIVIELKWCNWSNSGINWFEWTLKARGQQKWGCGSFFSVVWSTEKNFGCDKVCFAVSRKRDVKFHLHFNRVCTKLLTF